MTNQTDAVRYEMARKIFSGEWPVDGSAENYILQYRLSYIQTKEEVDSLMDIMIETYEKGQSTCLIS